MNESPLKAHEGIYLGLSPTDESAVGMGEAELVIDQYDLSFSLATGLEIYTTTFPVEDFRLMSQVEIEELFEPGEDLLDDIVAGFQGKEDGFPRLIFTKQAIIMWLGGMGDLLGPTLLAGPKWWPRLVFWFAGWMIDFKSSGGFPRLCYKGRMRRQR